MAEVSNNQPVARFKKLQDKIEGRDKLKNIQVVWHHSQTIVFTAVKKQ